MSSLAVLKNSDDGQIEDFDNAFRPVQAKGAAYEKLQGRANDALYDALEALFAFGEELRAEARRVDRPLVQMFAERHGRRWNAVTEQNPYGALVPLTFPDSSKPTWSQFSRVLQHAHDRKISPKELRAELAAKTIKVAYQEAVEFYDSAKRRSSQAKLASRIATAKTLLAAQSLSAPIALNTAAPLSPGYASVLVRINANNEAEIVSILDTNGDRLVLSAVDASPAVNALADRPLFGLYRAIDIVMRLTPDRTKGGERSILIRNTSPDTCRVMSIGTAYSAPWAYVDIPAIDVLAPEGHLLDHLRAAAFVQRYEQGDWSLASMGAGDLMMTCSPNEGASVALPRFTSSATLYIASPNLTRDTPFAFGQSQAAAFVDFLDEVRRTFERAAKKAPGKIAQPKRLALECDGSTASLRVVASHGGVPLSAPIFTLSTGSNVEQRYFSLSDVEGLCAVAKRYEFDMAGWFGSNAEQHIALVFEGDVDGDAVGLVLPTLVGTNLDYAQACIEFAA